MSRGEISRRNLLVQAHDIKLFHPDAEAVPDAGHAETPHRKGN